MIAEFCKCEEEGKSPILETTIYSSLQEWVEHNHEVLTDMESTSWFVGEGKEGKEEITRIIHRDFGTDRVYTLFPYWLQYNEVKDEGELVHLTKEEVESELFK